MLRSLINNNLIINHGLMMERLRVIQSGEGGFPPVGRECDKSQAQPTRTERSLEEKA